MIDLLYDAVEGAHGLLAKRKRIWLGPAGMSCRILSLRSWREVETIDLLSRRRATCRSSVHSKQHGGTLSTSRLGLP